MWVWGEDTETRCEYGKERNSCLCLDHHMQRGWDVMENRVCEGEEWVRKEDKTRCGKERRVRPC